MFRGFVLGGISGTLAISTAPSFSSNILHRMMGVSTLCITPNVAATWAKDSNGMIYLADVDNAIYSASAVDSKISICNFDPQKIGHCA